MPSFHLVWFFAPPKETSMKTVNIFFNPLEELVNSQEVSALRITLSLQVVLYPGR
jgi:hypothetical protein